jgi:hypothetical protein
MNLRRQDVVRSRVIHSALRSLVASLMLVVAASTLGAQQEPASDPHRWATALTLDLGSIPDAFTVQCGSGSYPSYGGGLAVLFRARRWVVATLDVRMSEMPDLYGCDAVAPAPVLIGPNEWESWAAKQFPNGVATPPLVRNALHIGVETSPEDPLLRATVGGGMIWTGTRTPFASVAIGGGSRGRGARFYWDLESSFCALRVRETHTRVRLDSNVATPLPPRIVSYVEHPTWTALHIGLEIPVVSSR